MEKENQAGNFRQNAIQSETEFASETNVQEVKKQNQQSEGR
ncbi:gamma-type small acid-soluble spore protein [Peribacillus sp. SI8-4]|nr:gamma-type small acid-soluble spore protein [Peribacillus sp. SI8-4]